LWIGSYEAANAYLEKEYLPEQPQPQATFTNSSGIFSFTVAVGGRSWPGRILVYDSNHLRFERAVEVSAEAKTQEIVLEPLLISSVQSEQRAIVSPLIQSFPGASWSPWVEVCASAGANEQVGVAQFRLEGDRSCGAWSECRETTHDSAKVCWQFRVQGHDEWRGPFGIAVPHAGPPNRGVLQYEIRRNIQTPPPEGQSGTILILFAGQGSDRAMESLGSSLVRNGFRVLNIERIDKKYASSVKYFHDEDKALAERVQALTATTLAGFSSVSPPAPEAVSGLENKARLGYLEIWLH
jgi:hypothetical protein